MIKEILAKVIEKNDLTEEEMIDVMNEIMSGQASPAQIASFITALRIKGESIDEIVGAARVMREKGTLIKSDSSCMVDTCGTGGDHASTFNISTAAAFVASGADVVIAKHGNRSVSSKCGSADVLQALGVNIQAAAPVIEQCINEIGIGFLFAPQLHPAMKHAIGPRRDLGFRTIFNILGPMTNPAGAKRQVLGVYDKKLTYVLAHVLKRLGSEHVWVIHGDDGLDEITSTGSSTIVRLDQGIIEEFVLNPRDYGIPIAKPEELVSGSVENNVVIIKSILNGDKGSCRDIVVLNAAAAIVCGNKAQSLEQGIKKAQQSIDSGAAVEKLNRLVAITNKVGL